MKANEGLWDRVIRAMIGMFLVYWGFFSGSLAGGTATLLGVVGLVLLITGAVGYCPLYALFHIRTLK